MNKLRNHLYIFIFIILLNCSCNTDIPVTQPNYQASQDIPHINSTSSPYAVNNSHISIAIYGTGFSDIESIELLKQNENAVPGIINYLGSNNMTVFFDLSNKTIGYWHLKATTSNYIIAYLSNALTVHQPNSGIPKETYYIANNIDGSGSISLVFYYANGSYDIISHNTYVTNTNTQILQRSDIVKIQYLTNTSSGDINTIHAFSFPTDTSNFIYCQDATLVNGSSSISGNPELFP